MILKKITILLCLIFVTSFTAKPDNTLRELDFIYNSILENHPGIYNYADPNFRENLERSYALAKSKIQRASIGLDSKKVINDFAKSFNDTHLWIYWFKNVPRKQNSITTKFTISKLSKDAIWVTIPTFDLNSKQERSFAELLKNISELKLHKYIIFDLRGNQGGNSEYGSQVIDALFGTEYANQKRCIHNKDIYVDWRASKGNLAHILSLLTSYPSNLWLQNIENGLQVSLRQGKTFYREYASEVCTPKKI